MGHVSIGGIIGCVICLVFIFIFAWILPHQYNQGVEQKQTHTSFCTDLHNQIVNSQNDARLQSLTIEYSKEYQTSCSGSG